MTTFISADEMLLYLQGTSVKFYDRPFFLAEHVLVDVFNQLEERESAATVTKVGYAILQDANIQLENKTEFFNALRSFEESETRISSALGYPGSIPGYGNCASAVDPRSAASNNVASSADCC